MEEEEEEEEKEDILTPLRYVYIWKEPEMIVNHMFRPGNVVFTHAWCWVEKRRESFRRITDESKRRIRREYATDDESSRRRSLRLDYLVEFDDDDVVWDYNPDDWVERVRFNGSCHWMRPTLLGDLVVHRFVRREFQARYHRIVRRGLHCFIECVRSPNLSMIRIIPCNANCPPWVHLTTPRTARFLARTGRPYHVTLTLCTSFVSQSGCVCVYHSV